MAQQAVVYSALSAKKAAQGSFVRNAVLAAVLLVLLCTMFIPFLPYTYTDQVETGEVNKRGRPVKESVEISGEMSAMGVIWFSNSNSSAKAKAAQSVCAYLEELGLPVTYSQGYYFVPGLVGIPIILMILTLVSIVLGLRYHRLLFTPVLMLITALVGIYAFAAQSLLKMQPLSWLVALLYGITACGAALAVWVHHKERQAMLSSIEGRKHYKDASLGKHVRKNWMIYSFLIIPIAFFVIFKYIPMVGNVIAFRTYNGGSNILGTDWRGLQYFEQFIGSTDFLRAFRNTLRLSLEYLAFRFPLTLIFALLLNEMRNVHAKKLVQTISYLPHFISTVILVGMVQEIVAVKGPINNIITALGGSSIIFMQRYEWFPTLYIGSGVWQGLGWGTILYLAAMTNINTELYEAAEIDGANRFRRVWHVTIPGILPTICTLLVLDIGGIMGSNFEKILLMYNELTYETADVISTYVYRMGIGGNQFSYSTAVGLFEGLIGLVLVTLANMASRKLTDSSLW